MPSALYTLLQQRNTKYYTNTILASIALWLKCISKYSTNNAHTCILDTSIIEDVFRDTEIIQLAFFGDFDCITPITTSNLDNVLISNKFLGSGSFGTVVAGKLDGKYVAIKSYKYIKNKDFNNNYEEWCIFMKEYAMLCRLQDTGIVGKFYGAGWNRGYWTMVTQRHSMRAMKWRHHVMRTCENTKHIILDIFSAIHTIHQITGHVHGDVKPDNIMIDTIDGHPIVKIIDFGLSEPIGIITKDYTYIQTVLWRSPELLYEEPCDLVLTDAWAAALAAFDIIAGRYLMYELGAKADINEIDMLHLILVKCIGRNTIPCEWEEFIDDELMDFANDMYRKYIVLASERKDLAFVAI